MRNITINTITYDDFVVLDKKNDPVTGLVDGDFTKVLYDPDGNERANTTGGITITINELGNGVYRLNFTPDKLGNWIILLTDATHFPWGKAQNYYCVTEAWDTIAQILKRIVGLCQENYRITEARYDNKRNMTSGVIKLYPTPADVDNDTNVIAEYNVEATYNRLNHMTGYKVKRII